MRDGEDDVVGWTISDDGGKLPVGATGGWAITRVLLVGSSISVSERTWELETAGAEGREEVGCTISETGGKMPVGTTEGSWATCVLLGSTVSMSEGVWELGAAGGDGEDEGLGCRICERTGRMPVGEAGGGLSMTGVF